MRQTIQRWHVGQLIMVWVSGILVSAFAAWIGWFALDVRGDRQVSLAFRQNALEQLARDSVANADQDLTDARRLTALALVGEGLSDSARALTRSWGYLSMIEREDARAVLAVHSETSTASLTALALFAVGIALVLPLSLWWGTWVWFAGRAVPPPPRAPASPDQRRRTWDVRPISPSLVPSHRLGATFAIAGLHEAWHCVVHAARRRSLHCIARACSELQEGHSLRQLLHFRV